MQKAERYNYMTITQKILAKATGLESVKPGQLIKAKLDMVLGNDITSPVAINEFEKNGFTSVYSKTGISLVMDHFTPNKDIKAAGLTKQCRSFAHKYDIKNFFDVGEMGIEHALLPEKGLIAPGECCIGADSHTCTYGALGAFSTGVGSTDMAAGMATGEAWFKVPAAIKFDLTGALPENVSGTVLVLCHSSTLITELCSGNITVLLKLLDSGLNAVNTVCGDNRKSCDSVVPIGRQTQNNGQQPL